MATWRLPTTPSTTTISPLSFSLSFALSLYVSEGMCVVCVCVCVCVFLSVSVTPIPENPKAIRTLAFFFLESTVCFTSSRVVGWFSDLGSWPCAACQG